jgi:hypothetical protein
MTDTSDLSEEQILAALAIVATPVGAAALLSEWRECVVTAEEVAQVIAGSVRLQRIAAACAKAQSGTSNVLTEERLRAMAGPQRWRDRRCRK